MFKTALTKEPLGLWAQIRLL